MDDFNQISEPQFDLARGNEDNYIPLRDSCRYKYLLYVDGWAQSSRLKYFLYCQSIIIGHEWIFYEYFTHLFRPNVDIFVVPITDIPEVVHWELLPELMEKVSHIPTANLTAIAAKNKEKAKYAFSEHTRTCVTLRSLNDYSRLMKYRDISRREGHVTFEEYELS